MKCCSPELCKTTCGLFDAVGSFEFTLHGFFTTPFTVSGVSEVMSLSISM